MKKKLIKGVALFGALLAAGYSSAQASGLLAVIDLSDVTDGVDEVKTAALLIVPGIIGAAMVFFGLKWAIGWGIGLFSKISKKG